MPFTHTIKYTWTGTSGDPVSVSEAPTGDAEDNRQIAVPDSTADQLVALDVDVSEIQSLFISSDQDLTLETNNGSTPDNTINLVANVPLIWSANSPHANPFTTDITALYVTNSSGSAAILEIRILKDSTP